MASELRLHPKALDAFNKKANGLFGELRPIEGEGPRWPFDPQIAGPPLTDADVLSVSVSGLFMLDGRHYGLTRDGWLALSTLSRRIFDCRGFAERVSLASVSEEIFGWLRERSLDETDSPLIAHILPKLQQSVAVRQVLLPINELFVEKEFSIGCVGFRAMSESLFNEWEQSATDKLEHETAEVRERASESDIRELYRQKRRRYQGRAAAVFQCEASPQRACELAYMEAERSLALLRLFTPPAYNPRYVSHLVLKGHEDRMTTSYFVLRKDQLSSYRQEAVTKEMSPLALTSERINDLFDQGLETLHELLLVPTKPSPFLRLLFDSLLLYSRSLLFPDISDRLVYTMTALESLLLRDKNESIQDNLARRIAFLAGDSPRERKEINRVVKVAYGLRSSFVHKNRRCDENEMQILVIFYRAVWRCLIGLVDLHGSIADQDALIQQIEDRVFT